MDWINYMGYSAVCTKTLKGLGQLKISKKIKYFWFPHILWVYLTRKTCGQHWFTSLNIYYNDLGHPSAGANDLSQICDLPDPCVRGKIQSKREEEQDPGLLSFEWNLLTNLLTRFKPQHGSGICLCSFYYIERYLIEIPSSKSKILEHTYKSKAM